MPHKPGGQRLSIGPADLPVVCEHPTTFTDIWAGDILLIMPDAEGRYVAERDGKAVIAGELRGYMHGTASGD